MRLCLLFAFLYYTMSSDRTPCFHHASTWVKSCSNFCSSCVTVFLLLGFLTPAPWWLPPKKTTAVVLSPLRPVVLVHCTAMSSRSVTITTTDLFTGCCHLCHYLVVSCFKWSVVVIVPFVSPFSLPAPITRQPWTHSSKDSFIFAWQTRMFPACQASLPLLVLVRLPYKAQHRLIIRQATVVTAWGDWSSGKKQSPRKTYELDVRENQN